MASKKILLSVLLCFIIFVSKAQEDNKYSKVDFGVGLGVNENNADTKSSFTTAAVHINLTYNQTPFVNYVFESEVGVLAGGFITYDPLDRAFRNDYTSFAARLQVQAGELIDYAGSPIANGFKNFYLSTGPSAIVNHIVHLTGNFSNTNYNFRGNKNTIEFFIPARIGYEFKMFDRYGYCNYKVDLAVQKNYVLGDQIDALKTNVSNDRYYEFIIGFKVAIGNFEHFYRKQITY